MNGKSVSGSMRPPLVRAGPLGWVWENLFSSPLNATLTLLSAYLLYLAVFKQATR